MYRTPASVLHIHVCTCTVVTACSAAYSVQCAVCQPARHPGMTGDIIGHRETVRFCLPGAIDCLRGWTSSHLVFAKPVLYDPLKRSHQHRSTFNTAPLGAHSTRFNCLCHCFGHPEGFGCRSIQFMQLMPTYGYLRSY